MCKITEVERDTGQYTKHTPEPSECDKCGGCKISISLNGMFATAGQISGRHRKVIPNVTFATDSMGFWTWKRYDLALKHSPKAITSPEAFSSFELCKRDAVRAAACR